MRVKKFSRSQLGGLTVGDIRDYTLSVKANKTISKGLRDQRERMRREKIKREILKDIFD